MSVAASEWPENPIIVALDVATAERAVRLARDVAPHVGGFKIGLGLLHGPGPGTISALVGLGKPVFADAAREFVLFCGAGWRSALAAKSLQDMGMTNVAHIDGGWEAWTKSGAPIETLEENKARRKGSA